ncbi:S46 family peptidase [candidate division KSB1 bacterium]|nr:S46 family peptidase [candidate division KSB1 bacterium]
MQKNITTIIALVIISFTFQHKLGAEEGMYPMSEIHKLELKSKGLEIDVLDIYNPGGISLIDGICKLDGCTGSFVSPHGLILTNHHCAYGAIQTASSEEHDYISNGFLARDRSEEIQAKGYTVRITESYRYVSKDVLSVIKKDMDYGDRTKAIEKKIKAIIKRAESKNPGKRAEVSEMFIGKTYILFIYTYLKDIRLVYAPPRSIGEFGGDIDNWEWPRHTGDFSFMRAYVAPDGSPAEYSANNVPFQPKNYLKVQPEGVEEGDFVFIFGYPGRTYRHQTSHYLDYEYNKRMPYVVDLYSWQNQLMLDMGKDDRSIAITLADRIKGRDNTIKNYQGKLKGIRRLNLIDVWREREKALQSYIDQDAGRKERYGSLLQNIGQVYEEIQTTSDRDLLLDYLKRNVTMFNLASTIYESSIERKKDDLEREADYMDRNFDRTVKNSILSLKSYHQPTDMQFMKKFLNDALVLPACMSIQPLWNIASGQTPEINNIDEFLNNAYETTQLDEEAFLTDAFKLSTKELLKINDPFISIADKLYPIYKDLREVRQNRKGKIDELHSQLVDVKKEFMEKEFIPDANSTLRFTYGQIKGYSPADAVYYHPITTVQGVLEKTTGVEPFDSPNRLVDLIRDRNFGRFNHEKLGGVPTCILYDMDTTGGNSGSPVLNARGEMVGINFDRAYDATINDYAWNANYSRSIAVDIRYVLWVTQKFGGADHLLVEMGID